MELTTAIAAFSAAMGGMESASKILRDWTTEMPETPAKQEAVKDLHYADECLKLAKGQIAESLGFPLCRKHFPPGIMLKIGEGSFQCDTCTGHQQASAAR